MVTAIRAMPCPITIPSLRRETSTTGVEDFAVALIDATASGDKFTLVVFNGPLSPLGEPAFLKPGLDLRRDRLFYFGTRKPKPYRLMVGPFNSDSAFRLRPSGTNYRVQ